MAVRGIELYDHNKAAVKPDSIGQTQLASLTEARLVAMQIECDLYRIQTNAKPPTRLRYSSDTNQSFPHPNNATRSFEASSIEQPT